jgi:glycosyltransferase involved in cell wall biosynthesis
MPDTPAKRATILMAAYTNYRRDPRVRREAEALVDIGHRVVFLASRQPNEPHRETISGVEVIKTYGLTNRRTSIAVYLLDYVLFTVMIFAHLLAHPMRYRLIHINNMPDFLVFGTWLARLMGTPVIHDVHDLMPELFVEKFRSGERHWIVGVLKWQERWAGRFASAVLTVEERLKDILGARGIAREKIHVLMNLPDDRIFAHRGPQAVKAPDAPFVLVYHGTLARRLGLDIAVRAVAKARAEVPNLQLRIIGAGEEREPLIALRDELGLQAHVSFSDGFVPVNQIPALIADADVGLIPLRMSSGTDIMLPTKLLEYVTMGIPCITPKTGTIARYFDDTMVEFFEAENVDALAKAIVRLRNDPQRCLALSQQATERFGAVYTWSRHRRVYTELVERLLSR